jgi:hypothetical protein
MSLTRHGAAAASARRQEDEIRNELFAGQEVTIDPSKVPLEELSQHKLVDKAVTTHKDTTATVQRALKVGPRVRSCDAQHSFNRYMHAAHA